MKKSFLEIKKIMSAHVVLTLLVVYSLCFLAIEIDKETKPQQHVVISELAKAV